VDSYNVQEGKTASTPARHVGRARGLRLTFLAKFTLLTLLITALTGAGLSYFLIARHEAAVEANEGVTAAGEVTTFFSGALAESARLAGRGDLAASRAALERAEAAANRIQFVVGVRVYRPDGRELYPGTGPANPRDVRETLQRADLWSQRSGRTGSPDAVIVQWLPLVNDEAVYVLAIDLSRTNMASQMAEERRAVWAGTGIAYALIFLSLSTLALGASRELERRRRQAEASFVQTLGILAQTIDCRDPYTAGHSLRVADYARTLASAVGLSERECQIVEHAALLHDLGKIGVPDGVLLKPGKLDADERLLIERHPSLGAHILGSISGMDDIVPCVLHHHERLDGSGYPARLSGQTIPTGARIIAVADTFDAMTTDRPYRAALSVEAAVRELQRVSGTQLDAAYVTAFVQLVEAGSLAPPARSPEVGRDAHQFGPRALEALPSNLVGRFVPAASNSVS
jgi:putative nucleotidyltransferase with HDIG domain